MTAEHFSNQRIGNDLLPNALTSSVSPTIADVFSHARMGLWDYEVRAARWRWSAECRALMGRDSEPDSIPISDLVHSADQVRVLATLAETIGRPELLSYEDEFRIMRPDGQTVWVMARGQVVRRGATAERISGVLVEIGRFKAETEALQNSTAEYEHRLKNILSIVQSIAVRSFAEDAPVEDIRNIFLERLHAMARAYAALAHGDVRGASLEEIVRGELNPFANRAEIEGPPVALEPTAARSLALIVHELAASSLRLGALSTPKGAVSVKWHIESDNDGPRFQLHWSERGGPRSRGKVPKNGNSLLEKVNAAYGLHGRLEHTPWGLKYEVDVPLSLIAIRDTPLERPILRQERALP